MGKKDEKRPAYPYCNHPVQMVVGDRIKYNACGTDLGSAK